MAIELNEKKESNSITKKLVFLFALLFLIISSIGYVFLKYVIIVNNETRIKELNQEISSQKSKEIIELETKAAEAEILIGDYKILFEERANIINFFTAFEAWAHPQIYYSDFTFDVETRTATMKGSVNSFGPIIQQMDIFQNQQLVENFLVSNVKLAEAGGVVFDLSLTIQPNLLK